MCRYLAILAIMWLRFVVIFYHALLPELIQKEYWHYTIFFALINVVQFYETRKITIELSDV